MKKAILNLGKKLNKIDQQQINGGFGNNCPTIDFICDELTNTGCCDYEFINNKCILVCDGKPVN
ncbi:hypothetical protein [Tenacibaculum amylolyticum]|uniref:hypothetical protein n=1 Tax=Tenacibaculum amylolyticum TaxID=104269 RepID=UPI0038942814